MSPTTTQPPRPAPRASRSLGTVRSPWLAQHLAAVRALVVLTLVTGIAYPLAVMAVGRVPGVSDRADGSLVTNAAGATVGSALLGQSFTDSDGAALPQYLQSRPSAARDGYDPLASGASNLAPEDVVDTPPDAATGDEGRLSLLGQVCARSAAVGALEGVDGRRPYCTTATGDDPATVVGAVLAVFREGGAAGPVTRVVSTNQLCPTTPFVAAYAGVEVDCRTPADDLTGAEVTPVRGDAPAEPVVPADAVTASASGLDPHISPEYARLQVPRIARARGLSEQAVLTAIDRHTDAPLLGFLGRPAVDVLGVNLDLDRGSPAGS